MRSVISIALAAILFLYVLPAWGQSDLNNRENKSIARFLTTDNHVDLQEIQSSGYQGSLNLDGFKVNLDPITNEPVILSTQGKAPNPDPDDIYWESGFGLPGCNDSIFALTGCRRGVYRSWRCLKCELHRGLGWFRLVNNWIRHEWRRPGLDRF